MGPRDESMLGPKDEGRAVQSSADPPSDSAPRFMRERSSGSAGPPRSMFKQSIPSSRPAPLEPEASERPSFSSRRISGRFERETFENEELPDERIRQEALRMLEVADDHLADSSYSVYRTSTGGYTAAPRAPKEKHTPSALSGFSLATARKIWQNHTGTTIIMWIRKPLHPEKRNTIALKTMMCSTLT